MGFFTTPTKTVDLGGGNSITLRSLTFGERQELQSKCMAVGASLGKRNDADVTLDIPRMTQLTWHKVIQDWQGPGFEGRPVTPANIDALPAWVVEQLTDAYNSLESLSTAEKKA